MVKILSLFSLLFLAACDNSVVNNSGALPPIEFKGAVWSGNVRYAKVQFVGVDQYGQPQRRDDGLFYGDEYHTDEKGEFTGAVQGSYSGSLIAVASYDDYSHVITAATGTQPAITEARHTQIRCVLPSGCKDELGNTVLYGDWYDAPTDFEMWGALSFAQGLDSFNISPATHLAAMYAFNESISDGTACDTTDANTCVGTLPKNTLFTPELIYQSNQRLKQLFILNTGLHVNTPAWYEGILVSDSIAEVESAKHGLLSMALQKFAADRTESVMATLKWWVDSFLNHDGSFYKDALTDYPAEIDAKNLFQAMVDIESDYSSADPSISNSALAAAAAEYQTALSGFNEKQLMAFSDVAFSAEIEDKILAAQALVSKIQTWAMGFETHQYDAFFEEDVSAEIVEIEAEWALYNQTLGPVMNNLLRPIINVAEYGLSCLRGSNFDGCDSSHVLHSLSGVVVSSATKSITFSVQNEAVTLEGDLETYININIVGSFDEALNQSSNYKTFVFTQVEIETADGVVKLLPNDGALPIINFWLGSTLQQNVAIEPVRIDVSIPLMEVVASAETHKFLANDVSVTLLGTSDSAIEDSPLHYNILTSNIEGKFSSVTGSGDALKLRFTLNSENAETYYSPNRFPDLEINIDPIALKNYGKLESAAGDFISNQGGWFTLPDAISVGDVGVQTLTDEVRFTDEGSYSSWSADYDDLKALLDLPFSSSARLGSLSYSGGETALVLFKTDSTDTADMARQCTRVDDIWGCLPAQSLAALGCGASFSTDTATVVEAFNWLKSEECISQVKIDGRGIYEINYPDLNASFISGDTFNATLSDPEVLGIENFYVSLASEFVDGQGEKKPSALFILNGSAPDANNVTLGVSLTHDYVGGTSGFSVGVENLIPYGENSFWLAVGQSSSEQDALVYYIQDGNTAMTVFGFDFDDVPNPSHNQPLAVIRYDGQLIGSMRKEGDIYVIRYINGTWQLL